MDYETIQYDFSNLAKAISKLSSECDHARKTALLDIKNELNKFFTDFKCTEVLYTLNTDHEFFGIQVSPMLHDEESYSKLFDPNCSIGFDHYAIEFDSQLFNGEFTEMEILALMIHDLNRLNNSQLLKDIVAIIDHVSVCNGEEIKINNLLYNIPFFIFALQDTARKMTSAFEFIPTDLAFADDFIRSYGLAQYYESGIFAIKKCRHNLEGQICCPALTMNWYMQRYHMTQHSFIDLVDDLKDAIKLTGSKLVRRMLDQTLDITIGSNYAFRTANEKRYYTSLTEAAGKKKMSLASQIKYNGLKSLEDDIYEYRMRIKNIETENEAINVIRQINNRMGIISDYLDTEELSESDRERFFKLYDKYDALREELSKKSVYSRKMYGLFVDYNALQQMSNNGTMLNTYY